jgi:hypothetical protein
MGGLLVFFYGLLALAALLVDTALVIDVSRNLRRGSIKRRQWFHPLSQSDSPKMFWTIIGLEALGATAIFLCIYYFAGMAFDLSASR